MKTSHTPAKYAIVGSRDWADAGRVRQFVRSLTPRDTIVSGGARGPDSWAVDEAQKLGMECIVFPAEWDKYGKSAGFRRNVDIVNECDYLVAFWDGKSKGTKSSIDIARKQGKFLHIFYPENKEDTNEDSIQED